MNKDQHPFQESETEKRNFLFDTGRKKLLKAHSENEKIKKKQFKKMKSFKNRAMKSKSKTLKQLSTNFDEDPAAILSVHNFFQQLKEVSPSSSIRSPEMEIGNKNQYKILKSLLKKGESDRPPTPPEFDEQIREFHAEKRIPNAERLRNLMITHKNDFDIARDLNDYFPLLEQRRKILKLKAWVCFICKIIVENRLFEAFILLVIIANSIALTVEYWNSSYSSIPYWADNSILAIYTVEMALKIIAYGFILKPGSYLRNGWNILDITIIITGYLPYLIGSSINLRSLRTLRLFRPLKMVSRIKSVKIVFISLVNGIIPMKDAFFALFIAYFIFGVVGMTLFSGYFKRRCFNAETGVVIYEANSEINLYQQFCTSNSECLQITHNPYVICGRMIQNPNYDTTQFDNILMAVLQVYQTSTFEGWSTDIMKAAQKTWGVTSPIWFVVCIPFISYILLTVVIVILISMFVTAKEIVEAEMKIGKKKKTLDLWGQEHKIHLIDERKLDVLSFLKRYNKTGGHHLYTKVGDYIIPVDKNGEGEWTFACMCKKLATKVGSIFSRKRTSVKIHRKSRSSRIFPNQVFALDEKLEHELNQLAISDGDGQMNKSNNRMRTTAETMSRPMDPESEVSKIEQSKDTIVPLRPDVKRVRTLATSEDGQQKVKIIEIAGIRSAKTTTPINNMRQSIVRLADDHDVFLKNMSEASPSSNQFEKSFDHGLNVMKKSFSKKTALTIKEDPKRDSFDVSLEGPASEQLDKKRSLDEIDSISSFSEEEEQQPHGEVINLRSLKVEPILNFAYESNSTLDVMPSLDEVARIKELEERTMKPVNFPMYYQITKDDINNERQWRGMRLAEYSKAHANMFPTSIRASRKIINVSSGFPAISDFTDRGLSSPKKKDKLRGGEKFVDYDQCDYNQWVKLINKDDGLEYNYQPELDLDQTESWRQIIVSKYQYNFIFQKKDIAQKKISTHNWSGNDTLAGSSDFVQTLLIKKALNNPDSDIWRIGIKGEIHAIRKMMRSFSQTSFFQYFFLICVLINTIMLSSIGLTDEDTTNSFEEANTVFTFFYLFEVSFKLIAFGPKDYVRDKMNILDCLVVLFGMLELFAINSGKKGIFQAIRIVRVLRVIKLVRYFSFLNVMFRVLSRASERIGGVMIFVLLFIYIFTLLGIQVFGGKFNFPDNTGPGRVRENFDNFIQSFLSIFQCATLTNWNNILYFANRLSPNSLPSFIGVTFLCVWTFLGNYIVLTLIFCLILSELGDEDLVREMGLIDEAAEEIKLKAEKTLKALRQSDNFQTSNSSNEPEELETKRPAFVMFRNIECEYSLYLFSKDNRFRQICYRIMVHPYFEFVVIFAIFTSCVKLIIDSYIYEASHPYALNITQKFDYLYTYFFVSEIIIKVVSCGFGGEKGSYWSDHWNKVNFFVTSAGVLALELTTVKQLAFAKAFRAYRPIRFFNKVPSLKKMFTGLAGSIIPMLNMLLVIFLLYLIVAIVSVNSLGGGQMDFCLVPGGNYYGINRQECLNNGWKWFQPPNNFDNVFNALIILFDLSLQTDWNKIMNRMSDANEEEYGPDYENKSTFSYIFVVTFLLISAQILMSLFVGVIFLKYRESRVIDAAKSPLTDEQKDWVTMQILIQSARPDFFKFPPNGGKFIKFRRFIFDIISSKWWDRGMALVILSNIIVLALPYDDQPLSYGSLFDLLNYVFTGIFATEMVLKHIGFGFRRYWSSAQNKFDAIVVMLSIIDILLNLFSSGIPPQINYIPRVAKCFRILRCFKLLRRFKGLMKLLNVLYISLPGILTALALTFLTFFVFSLLAGTLFEYAQEGYYGTLDEVTNFENFFNSWITLFRCSTGENYYLIQYDLMYPTKCLQPDCGQPYVAPIFFTLHQLITFFILPSLFIFEIEEAFSTYYLNDDNPYAEFERKFQDIFSPVWEKFSMKHEGLKIKETSLIDFMMALKPPLGYEGEKITKIELAKQINTLKLTVDEDGFIYYHDLLYECFKRAYVGAPNNNGNFQLYLEELKTKRKIERIKRGLVYYYQNCQFQTRKPTIKKGGFTNPAFRMLLIGLTFKCWMSYMQKKSRKIENAKESGFDYISSDQSIDDDLTEPEEIEEAEDEDSQSEASIEQYESKGRDENIYDDVFQEKEENYDVQEFIIPPQISEIKSDISQKSSEKSPFQILNT